MRKRRRAPTPSDDNEPELPPEVKSDGDDDASDKDEEVEEWPELEEAWSGFGIGGEGKEEAKEEKEGKRGERKEQKESKKKKKERDTGPVEGLDDTDWGEETWPGSFKFCKNKPEPTKEGTFASASVHVDRYFNLFFTPALWAQLLNMTNRRAAAKEIKGWVPLEPPELKAWVGVNIFMGICHLPNTRLYWDREFGIDRVRHVLTRKRFLDIKSCWSFTDAAEEPARGTPLFDTFYKVRPLLDELNRQFPRYWQPGAWLTADERIVAYKGRHQAKQYIRNKPTKWGFKLWELACATSAYIMNVSAYIGKSEDGDDPKDEALGTQVVCQLMEPYAETGRAVAMDNFFSSVDLAQKLWNMGVGMVATVKPNRRGMPLQFRKQLKAEKQKLEQDEYKVLQCGDIRVTLWKDRQAVLFISSAVCDPHGSDRLLRWRDGEEREQVPCPPVAKLYNTYMRGVDIADQLQSYYPPGTKQLRWQANMAWDLIDKCIVNAWILRKGDPLMKEMSHLDFRLQLVVDLIDNYSNRQRPGPNPAPRVGRHQLVKRDKKGNCAVCSDAQHRAQARYGCKYCDVHVCPTCYDKHVSVVG